MMRRKIECDVVDLKIRTNKRIKREDSYHHHALSHFGGASDAKESTGIRGRAIGGTAPEVAPLIAPLLADRPQDCRTAALTQRRRPGALSFFLVPDLLRLPLLVIPHPRIQVHSWLVLKLIVGSCRGKARPCFLEDLGIRERDGSMVQQVGYSSEFVVGCVEVISFPFRRAAGAGGRRAATTARGGGARGDGSWLHPCLLLMHALAQSRLDLLQLPL